MVVPPLPALPAEGELVATGDFLLSPGGCAANTAICLSRLGIPAAVAGRVGDDLFGEFLVRVLRERGIDTSGVRVSPGSGTSKTVVLPVAGEDRRFVHTFGANADFTAADVDRGRLGAVDVFYVGGYLVLPGLAPGDLGELLAAARAAGARTVLDVVVPRDADVGADRLGDVLPDVDVFLPNEDEARALTGETDPRRQAERLRAEGAETVVVTSGPRGALLAGPDGELEVPAPRVEVVDSSGAGDAFAAGFICGLLEGWDAGRCLAFASVLGASATTALGTTAGVLARAEAEERMESPPR